MAQKVYYLDAEQHVVESTIEEIRAKQQAGELTSKAMVWQEGMDDWMELGKAFPAAYLSKTAPVGQASAAQPSSKLQMDWLKTFQIAYENLDGLKIKESVDKHGIAWFINYCAGLASVTGAASGLGGGATLLVGLPVDLANSVAQQFRITLAVLYHKTGRHTVDFNQFIKIVGLSVAAERGIQFKVRKLAIKPLVDRIGRELVKRLAARSAVRIVPLIGAVAGGGVNFLFIQAIGRTLLALDDDIFESASRKENPQDNPAQPHGSDN